VVGERRAESVRLLEASRNRRLVDRAALLVVLCAKGDARETTVAVELESDSPVLARDATERGHGCAADYPAVVSDKRRAKFAIGVLSTLAVSMVVAAVVIAIAANDADGELSAPWGLAFVALLCGFALTVGMILGLRESEPPKSVSVKRWLWPLLILGNGAFLGTAFALANDRADFWDRFAIGFALGVMWMSFNFLLNTLPKALHRFVKRS
jgi:hypothetical protein